MHFSQLLKRFFEKNCCILYCVLINIEYFTEKFLFMVKSVVILKEENLMPRRGENIHKRKDGRWEGRYIREYDSDGNAKYSSVYARTYLEVKQKLRDAITIPKSQQRTNKENTILFKDILFLWLDRNRITLKPQTYAKYLYMIENHIIDTLGSYEIASLTATIINQVIVEKFYFGRLDGKGGLSASYIRTITFIVSAAIEFAVTEGYRTPLNGSITKPQKQKIELEVLTIKEQLQLENYLYLNIDQRKLGVLLSLYTGMRIGEVCGLKWADINFETQTIHIRNTVERIKNINRKNGEPKTILTLCNAKTITSDRIIPIPAKIFKLLLIYRGTHEQFVMGGVLYDYIDPRTFQYNFQSYLKESNIRSVNFHALRHTFATRCIESGMDIKTLSEILGHSSVNITLNTYVHTSLERKRTQMNSMLVYCGQQ